MTITMKKCSRCILPENYPGIRFNENGVCNYCLTHEKMKCYGKEGLDDFLAPFRNTTGKYDCVVGISGGRDSSYALYYLVKVCGLRALAYSADNGFVPEVAKINMKKISDVLDVELVIEEHNFLKRYIAHNISSWLRKPSPSMIPMICCGCRLGMFRGLLECAKKNKIPLVVLGSGNSIEDCIFKKAFFTANPFGRRVRKNTSLSLLCGLLYEVIRNPSYFLNVINTIVYIEEYLYFFHLEKIRRLFYPNQKILYLYRYLEWDEGEILSTIRTELNWKKDVDSASSWRSDCRVSFLKNYLLRESVGFTEKNDFLCGMIRENMITRDIALEKIKIENTLPENLINGLIHEIGLDSSDIGSAAMRARKTYNKEQSLMMERNSTDT